MPFCHKCGAKLEAGDEFCVECGTLVKCLISDKSGEGLDSVNETEEIVKLPESVQATVTQSQTSSLNKAENAKDEKVNKLLMPLIFILSALGILIVGLSIVLANLIKNLKAQQTTHLTEPTETFIESVVPTTESATEVTTIATETALTESTKDTSEETTTATTTSKPTKNPTKKPASKPTYIPKGWEKWFDWGTKYKGKRIYIINRIGDKGDAGTFKGWYNGKWINLYTYFDVHGSHGEELYFYRDKKHKKLYFKFIYDDTDPDD